ncbi:hypothetical protein SAY86_012057 [Trapa natans]|uniref:Uncharacterized protein n=1 Tax=Trapa natans TaxID=22666 RepID=A0AAN7MBF4_TRANT|nr:hypothetical protein SAY86_012057 [Trapa natans]
MFRLHYLPRGSSASYGGGGNLSQYYSRGSQKKVPTTVGGQLSRRSIVFCLEVGCSVRLLTDHHHPSIAYACMLTFSRARAEQSSFSRIAVTEKAGQRSSGRSPSQTSRHTQVPEFGILVVV